MGGSPLGRWRKDLVSRKAAPSAETPRGAEGWVRSGSACTDQPVLSHREPGHRSSDSRTEPRSEESPGQGHGLAEYFCSAGLRPCSLKCLLCVGACSPWASAALGRQALCGIPGGVGRAACWWAGLEGSPVGQFCLAKWDPRPRGPAGEGGIRSP